MSRRTIIRTKITSLAHGSTAVLSQQVLLQNRRKAKTLPKFSSIAIYMSIFVLLVSVIAVGYQAPKQSRGVASASSVTKSDSTTVDDVVAANIAANTAVAADLSVKAEVLNKAATAQLVQEYSYITDDSTTTPQIIQQTSDTRSISSYTAKSGEKVDDVARQFGVSKETIKWVNNLTTDNLREGQTLKILPVDGILYTVKAGDTIASISDKYKVNTSRLVLYNDLEISGLQTGAQIILPNATLPTNERPGYVAPVTYIRNNYGYVSDNISVVNPGTYIGVSVYANRFSAGNRNANGQCTWYAWERRNAIGRPLPNAILGDAGQWARTLSALGYTVNTVPEVGAVIQNGGRPGHVGVVEQIRSDGSILISDMNYGYRAFQVTQRVIPASATGYFNYIH